MGDYEKMPQDDFFDLLYQKQFHKMWLLAISIVNNTALAEEVVQDAFVEVLLHIDYIQTVDRPDYWLQKTVRNKCLHVLREYAKNAKRLIDLEASELIDESVDKEFKTIEESDSLSNIKELIAKTLKPDEFYLLKRIAMEGISYKIVSEETGLSIGNCQKRMQRIRKKLREVIRREVISPR